MIFEHKPVLLKEAVDYLSVQNGRKYIDATAGGGGHTQEIIKRGGQVLAIDQDHDAVAFLKSKFANEKKIVVVQANFSDLKQAANENGFDKVWGILFDLGLSSYQIEQSGRGFSFRREEKLDMRMDENRKLTAGEIVNNWSRDELYEVFSSFGEQHDSYRIIDNIMRTREEKTIETASELAKVIEKAVGKGGLSHPATKVFQALRIAVNDELGSIRSAIPQAYNLLDKNGRIVVISFHSLEDRIIKRSFIDFETKGMGKVITKKPIIAQDAELEKNIRARSAKMRVFEKN